MGEVMVAIVIFSVHCAWDETCKWENKCTVIDYMICFNIILIRIGVICVKVHTGSSNLDNGRLENAVCTNDFFVIFGL